jgi:uncharacterized protein (DUF1499 family)
MWRTILSAVLWLGVGATLALAVALWRGDGSYGISSLWQRLFGPPDLGAAEFATLQRSATGNDALICPPGVCGSAPTDGVSPIFAVPVARLRDAVRVIEVNDPDIFVLARDDQRVQDRYLARTRLMRFPDTINVRFVTQGEDRSTLALYSRSQVGRKDFGINKARLEAWIKLLREQLPVVQP